MRRAALRFLASLLLVSGCAVNPATGHRQLSLVGEQREIALGRDAAAEVSRATGIVADSALEAYVSAIGRELAAASERPDLPWSFQVVDDPGVNAFALPGGFIYVTRGILANLESEAELAGVIGHEIGHVTARHSVSRISRQQLQQLGLGVGSILSSDVRRYQDVLSSGLGLLNLRYSRGDENQADALGFRYVSRAGWSPDALLSVFGMLATVSSGQGKVPEWQSTHPAPENREAHIRDLMASASAAGDTKVGRDRFLTQIQGLVYGNDPRAGYFKASRFVHPALAFELRFPEGWTTANQRTAVAAVSPRQDALVVLEVAEGGDDPAAALQSFLGGRGIETGRIRRETIGGIARIRATFTATTTSGTRRGEVAFLRHGESLYRILGYAAADAWASRADEVAATLSSFGALTDPAVLGVQPWRVEVLRLPEAMTMRQVDTRYPSVIGLEAVARLNRRTPDERLEPGTLVKRVRGRPLPQLPR